MKTPTQTVDRTPNLQRVNAAHVLLLAVLLSALSAGVCAAPKRLNEIYAVKVGPLASNLPAQTYEGSLTEPLATGLYAPTTLDCASRWHCSEIDGRAVSSCASYDFGSVYHRSSKAENAITIRYAQTTSIAGVDGCEGRGCGEHPGLLLFTSRDGGDWRVVESLPGGWDGVFTSHTVSPPAEFRYAAVCRAGADPDADNILVQYVRLAGLRSQNVFSYHQDRFLTFELDALVAEAMDRFNLNRLGKACDLLVLSYLRTGDESRRERALGIADFFVHHSDEDSDGIVGWGYPPEFDGHADLGCAIGEADMWGDGTCNAVDTETVYHTARAVRCLAAVFEIGGDAEYLDTAVRALEDSMAVGTTALPGCGDCYYYWTSTSEFDVGRFLRNMNAQTARAAAHVSLLSGSDRFEERAREVIAAELLEIDSSNRGYLSLHDSAWSDDPDYQSQRLNDHHAATALYLSELGLLLAEPTLEDYARLVMDQWLDYENPYGWECGEWSGDIDACTNGATFYPCALRALSDRFEAACLHEVNEVDSFNLTQSWYTSLAARAVAVIDPLAPAHLVAVVDAAGVAELSWRDVSDDESGFELERTAPGSGSWETVATAPADSEGHRDSGLSCSSEYRYRARSFRLSDGRFSSYSNTATVSTDRCRALSAARHTRPVRLD